MGLLRNEAITIKRYGSGSWVNGNYTDGSLTTITGEKGRN